MSKWLSEKIHQGFKAVAHVDGPAFSKPSNTDVIDRVLILDSAPPEINDYFNSFVGKPVESWEILK
ncbi:hypothetical protein EXE10_01580 [Acinetobacter sp. WCHAc060033]|uniref:hypothetical protein n=1 Tax=Acinetobacter sp. WCHAc060033 TaxID=2518624 RepID=UPI001022C45D|nr:hypothetical protein [Acinetobacter sp. WCHAc060033]RZG88520.1 hypothetical protein EXE10_01580 [Acinetobacter sp. WCHAc060033]